MKRTYVKIEYICRGQSQGCYIEDPKKPIDFSDIEGMEDDDCYKLTPTIMTEEEYAKLPEFQGW